jgi:hypothetical protein
VTGAAQALSRFHAGRRAAVEQGEEAQAEGAGTAWFEPAPSAPSDARPEPGAER